MEAAPTFEFFADVPKDQSLSDEVVAYQKDFNDCKGLIPEQAMPHMLGVSRQRWYQMKADYKFKTYTHFGKNFLSYPIAVEFCKVKRPDGPSDSAKALRAILQDLSRDE